MGDKIEKGRVVNEHIKNPCANQRRAGLRVGGGDQWDRGEQWWENGDICTEQ